MTHVHITAARQGLAICPHLGRQDVNVDGEVQRPIPDGANRCLALSDPIRLSPDQQRLVCATERHRACRLYVLAESGAAPATFEPIRPLLLRPAIIGALVVLGLAVALAIGYLLSGGSLVVSGIHL